ncbi:MAG: D-alanyl-D-alanine carboxypeptidase [Gammaproteobacteria bacterium]|nr:D-alanyl-D-alanine carboxypeptidase [Gammaproteobacteria bacterium]
MNRNKFGAACVALLLLADAASGAVGAARAPGLDNTAQATIFPPAPQIEGTSYLLIDVDTRKLLVENDIHFQVPPASLTKIMTSYVAAVELQAGRINLEDQVPISVKAWRTPGSRMFVREGTKVMLEDLLRGVVIQSGNDASVAVAEHIAGSEDAFADMMNQQAVQLGMSMTQYHNATGLPSEGHQTTAWDLALLTLSLIGRFPDTYATYAERSFTYNDIEQPNRNRLLWRDRTVDGVKTGHTRAAGYCLVASAKRGNMRLISVIMGASSEEARMRESQKLLSYGFRNFETQKLYDAGVPLKTSELWYGEAEDIELGVSEKVFVTIPRGHYSDLKAELKVARIIEAPVALGQEFGELRLLLNDKLVYVAPLVALAAVDEAGFFSRIGDGIYLLFQNMFSSG